MKVIRQAGGSPGRDLVAHVKNTIMNSKSCALTQIDYNCSRIHDYNSVAPHLVNIENWEEFNALSAVAPPPNPTEMEMKAIKAYNVKAYGQINSYLRGGTGFTEITYPPEALMALARLAASGLKNLVRFARNWNNGMVEYCLHSPPGTGRRGGYWVERRIAPPRLS